MLLEEANLCFLMQYGKQLYVNYQEAMRRTEAAHDWSSLSSSSMKSGSSSSSLPGESTIITCYDILIIYISVERFKVQFFIIM